LQKFLDQKYNSLGKIFAEQVILDLEDNPLVELKYAFRLLPEAGQLAIHNPMRLGNLLHNQSLSIILEFLVKPGLGSKTDLKILTGSVRMDIPTNDIPTYRMSIDLSRAITLDTSPESTPIQLVQALSKLTLYRIQERAREEVSAGEIQKATRHLQYLATHLLSQGEKELAQTVLVEAENIHQNKKFSNEGDKRIKYGTRALFLPAGMENNSL
jgi:Ca-activated chloride channel family protein